MTLDFSVKEDVQITMYDQIDNIINESPEIYKSGIGPATASPSNLYSVQKPCEDNKMLTYKDRKEYHTLTARCVYMSKTQDDKK